MVRRHSFANRLNEVDATLPVLRRISRFSDVAALASLNRGFPLFIVPRPLCVFFYPVESYYNN